MKQVLFVCVGNSARSIMAEALLNHYGGDRFCAVSGGSEHVGMVNPAAISTLKKRGIDTKDLRSKSVNEFLGKPVDIAITLCDDTCPAFTNDALRAHWPIRDPAALAGKKKQIAEEFSDICDRLERRIQMLIHLPVETMDKETLAQKLSIIGGI